MAYEDYVAQLKEDGQFRAVTLKYLLLVVGLTVLIFPMLWANITDRFLLFRRETQPGLVTFGIYLLQGVRVLAVWLVWTVAPTWFAVLATVTLAWRWHKTWAAWSGTNWWLLTGWMR